jgi:hypothetical protein
MDKPSPPAVIQTFQRRGFALIITLSVLTVIIALTGVMISYLDIARKDATQTEAMMQANLYFSDIKELLVRFKEKKALYTTLYTTMIPIVSDDGRFSLSLKCRPLANGVNINWLGETNNPLMEAQYNAAQSVFEALAGKYEIEDPSRLSEMLYEEIRMSESENPDRESRLVQKNGIISYKQFEHLLSRYQFETDDQNIGKIPWEKYFVFNPVPKVPEENRIAGDYMSVELISVLFDIDQATLKEEWQEGDGALKRLLSSYGIAFNQKLYAMNFVDQSSCTVKYAYRGKQFAFRFIDKEGEVKNFEFYGEQ